MSDAAANENGSHNEPVGSLKYAEVKKLLRKEIASGEFRNSLLSEVSLLKHLETKYDVKVSLMPVRRAIAFFAAEGILAVQPKKGTTVRIPDDNELREIWAARVTLEEFVIVQLARKRRTDFSAAITTHKAMLSLAGSDDFAFPTSQDQVDFVELDQKFHEQLVTTAGYPRLADELNLLRFKLQLAAPVAPFPVKKRFRDICVEHERILEALGGIPNREGTRPDINSVRLAFLVHMRNSARFSWRIEQRIKSVTDAYSLNYVFDVPDMPTTDSMNDISIGTLLELRFNVEVCAISVLAMKPNEATIMVLESLHQEMEGIAAEFSKIAKPDRRQLESLFINLDMSLHAAMCFSAGMLFGEEVISYTWHRLHKLTNYRLSRRRITDILREHKDVITALKNSRGSPEDVKNAVDALEIHLFGSFLRNNFDLPMLTEAIKQGNSRLALLKKAAQQFAPDAAERAERMENN